MSRNDEVRCRRCGWEGRYKELQHRTVYEDYGDVCCAVCPSCHATEYDGMVLFEELTKDVEEES